MVTEHLPFFWSLELKLFFKYREGHFCSWRAEAASGAGRDTQRFTAEAAPELKQYNIET